MPHSVRSEQRVIFTFPIGEQILVQMDVENQSLRINPVLRKQRLTVFTASSKINHAQGLFIQSCPNGQASEQVKVTGFVPVTRTDI